MGGLTANKSQSAVQCVDAMPEAFVSSTAISREVSRRVKAGELRKLGSRLYTTNLVDAPEAIVRRNLWDIVAGYFPGALIADRTALENAPAEDGSVCLVTESGRALTVHGVTLRPRRGAGPQEFDRPFLNALFLSSTARAWLDNLRPSRARGGRLPRTFSRLELEDRLDNLIRRGGVDAANRLRDEARALAPRIGRTAEAKLLDALIGDVLGTRDSQATPLTSPGAQARRRGRPYDPHRMRLFEILHKALRDMPPSFRPARRRGVEAAATLAFYDAYFSNFIEGTEFAVDEAAEIVFQGRVPAERPADAHDILGVWRIASNPAEMRRTPKDADAFLDLLRQRHAAVMANRSEVRPGEFKRVPNQAGATLFVLPDDVPGTLEHGFGMCRSLETPFQRAVLTHFLVAEVHPFADGNGRVARIMMNAELAAGGEERILIPTVYHGNYIAAQRALSHNGVPTPLIQTLDYAQRWTAAVDWCSVRDTARELAACNAFLESGSAEQEGLRLRMPGRIP